MIGGADDALLFCLLATAFLVAAHGVDALGSRRDKDDDGWAHSLALALLGLAVGMLVLAATFASSSTDLLVTLASCAAIAVSAMPLVGFRFGNGTRERPANPWDRAYRVRPARVAQLLSPARPAPAPAAPREPRAYEGVVLPDSVSGQPAPPRDRPERPTAPTGLGDSVPAPATPPASQPGVASAPEVYEAEETLNDVSQVVGDLGRLLGLDSDDRRR